MKVENVDRKLAASMSDKYKLLLQNEAHHNHELVKINEVIQWKQNPFIEELTNRIILNELILLLDELGYDKNSEIYRKLYRDMGYSPDPEETIGIF